MKTTRPPNTGAMFSFDECVPKRPPAEQKLPLSSGTVNVETPTGTDAAAIAAISTDPDPDPAFYRTSVKDALAAGRPFLLVFSTPQFCASRTCGPTLDTVKAAVAPFGDAIEVIHVEPYKLQLVDGQLQPELDAQGGFQVVPSVAEWGIPTEPYAFLVGADGKVAAKFEGALGADELGAAIESVLGSQAGS